jgi:hypothetical protein
MPVFSILHKTLQNVPKFGFFGFKIYHLATLIRLFVFVAALNAGFSNLIRFLRSLRLETS